MITTLGYHSNGLQRNSAVVENHSWSRAIYFLEHSVQRFSGIVNRDLGYVIPHAS